MAIIVGQFVQVAHSPERVGKCLQVGHEQVEVEWFYSVVDRRHVHHPLKNVSPFVPSPQTRCYWFNPDTSCWETGRFVSSFFGIVCVAFPEGQERNLPECEVYIRCHIGRPQPLDLMAHRFFETPYFHSARAPLVRSLTRQVATTHGLTALLSSRIFLFDHQINVIRRVLEDPVQRYLLADEVGLGKTIEAGVILRQALTDNPRAKALVITPQTLTAQWRRELALKHGLAPDTHALDFVTHRDIAPYAQLDYDIVVIDEAHHVARMAYASSDDAAWAFYQELCHRTPSLLLLSATPALHHEADFLAMLHLLEPQTFRLEEVESFRARVSNREGVAATLDLLHEGIRRRREIQDAVDILRENFSDDSWLMHETDVLDEARTEPNTIEIDAVVRRMRIHLCESHRIHRRMLRSSRRRVQDILLPQRSTGSVITELTIDPRAGATQYALDSWREAAQLADAFDERYLQIFRAWLSLGTTWVPYLRDAILLRLSSKIATEPKGGGVEEALAHVLTSTPLFDGEGSLLKEWLAELKDDPESTDQIDDLLDVLKHHRSGRHVVFTAYTGVAKEIVRRLPRVMNSAFIYAHLETMPVGERDALLERFSSESTSAVLVCDRSGEEGLNLQFVDRLIHFDLPWDPNRLEQRIGRMDRIGRTGPSSPIHVFVPEEPEVSFAEAYLHLLRNGVDLFRTSVADLQFLLEREIAELVRVAFQAGAGALRRKAKDLSKAIIHERRLLRQQSAVDELEAYDTDETAFAAELREEDNQTAPLQSSLNRWMNDVLNFRSESAGSGFIYTQRTLLPRDWWEPISREIPKGRHATFIRKEALVDHDAELMRLGHPFIDKLLSYMAWEDRGQAFALWRELKTEKISQDSAYFQFDFIIEPDMSPLERATPSWDEVRRRPLLRQTIGWDPPRFATVYVDATTGQCVRNSAVLETLQWPYDQAPHGRARDTNLGRASRRPLIAEVIDDYAGKLGRCYDEAVAIIRTDEDHIRERTRSVQKATRTLETRLDQLRRGLIYRGHTGNIEEEKLPFGALIEGIKLPCLTLDAAGLIILSNRDPFIVESGDNE